MDLMWTFGSGIWLGQDVPLVQMRCGFSLLPNCPASFYLTNNNLILQNIQPTFSILVIVEPMVGASQHEPIRSLRERLVEIAKKRQVVWPIRQDLETVFAHPKHSAATLAF
jgi:hypothetical protein